MGVAEEVLRFSRSRSEVKVLTRPNATMAEACISTKCEVEAYLFYAEIFLHELQKWFL